MRSRAIVGLFGIAVAASPLAFAHASGVTHTYENGQPVITVRLVPDEAAVAKANRVDALEPAAPHAAPSEDAGLTGAETVETFDAAPTEDPSAPALTEPTNELPAAEAAPGPGAAAAVSRYPGVRPALKPTTETGVGGVLDLAPPAEAETAQPRPMRLNQAPRNRNVADRAPRQREQRARPQRAPAAPVAPDPLDEALPSRIVDAPQPVNAMQLPPPKAEERIAGGN